MATEMERELSGISWEDCPRCWNDLVDKKNKLEQRCVNEYGKIPKEEYMVLVEESRLAIEKEHSFKAKFEIGMRKNGKFTVEYRATCTSCGYFFTFHHTEQAEIYDTP